MPQSLPLHQSRPETAGRSPLSRWLDFAALGTALGLGSWFWLFFFGYGHLKLSFEDWPMHGFYLDIFRQSIAGVHIPWEVNWWPQGTDKFLAVPETPLSPLLLLLPWISNALFVALHIVLLYGVGVWGWWTLKKNLGWSREAFLLAVIIGSFNGYIVSRLAVGHLIWCGYFLSPWLLLALRKILLDAPERAWVPLAFGLLALFFLGSFHMAIWWFFLIGFAALARPRALVPAFLAIASACVMAAFRIVPAVAFVHEKSNFLTGYADGWTLLNAFTRPQGYTPVATGGEWTASRLGWWEFNHYVGWPALLFVLLAAAATLIFWRKNNPVAVPLAAASAAVAILSLGHLYACIFNLPSSMFHSERISSRFIEVSFLALLLVAVNGLESLTRVRRFSQLLCVILLVLTVHDLWSAAQPWLLPQLENSHPFSGYFPDLETLRPALVTNAHRARYHAIVLGSWSISAVSIAWIASLTIRKRKKSPLVSDEAVHR